MIRLSILFLLTFLSFFSNAQNIVCFGVNAGWRSNGPTLSYLFLKHFEEEIVTEWQYYNSFGIANFIKVYPFKKNLEKHTFFVGIGANHTFGTNFGTEYKNETYKYRVNDINYLIPKIGYTANETIIKEKSYLKSVSFSIELQYAFRVSKTNIVFLDKKQENTDLTSRINRYYNNRGLGINIQLKLGFGSKK